MKAMESLEDFVNKQENKVRQKIRNKAFKNAETSLILAGRKLHDLTPEEWEHLVAEEEKSVWEKYMKGGIATLLAIAFFGTP
ncbi:hypothetical protein N9J53_01280 [Gammaproteobacteria bacterium]|jgi:hypothetical protein|nr:hypothetical protein [Gammaproteobacteria bacterium]MDA9957558.1 hypothetical protein [Gammaproteobacteria bacterium]|tara:strand:- start:2330 stop:2575 length:246 start_codon:yes stop_codon:yes gene_type:complete